MCLGHVSGARALIDFIDHVDSDSESTSAPLNPMRGRQLGSEVLDQAALLARCEQLCGLTMSVIDPVDGRFVSGIPKSLVPDTLAAIRMKPAANGVHVIQQGSPDVWVYCLRVPGTDLLAGGVLLPSADSVPDVISEAVRRLGLPDSQFESWRIQHSGIRPHMALKLIQTARSLLEHEQLMAQSRLANTSVVEQLGHVYEEMVLLQDLPKYMQPGISPLSLAEAVISQVQQICGAELSAYCLRHHGAQSDLIYGPWGFEGSEIESLICEILAGRPPTIIVKNQIDTSRWQHRYPRLRSLVAIPLFETDESPSWLVLANSLTRPELGSEEASLLKSIGHLLVAHTQICELFREREDMVLDFIRSLVSTIDAKDAYTRGHSERVALVAERIAQDLGLPPDEVLSIYQSGLLHDIGKIGIDDAVLRKPAALTPSEFQHMALHPEFGYKILSQLKSLSQLLDGVLYHHERYDGRGYPQQLSGTTIPRMARVLAVADAFDAMRSDRPYRQGMNSEAVERILTNGAGTQWDPEVVKAFLADRIGIDRIWNDAVQRMLRELDPTRAATPTE